MTRYEMGLMNDLSLGAYIRRLEAIHEQARLAERYVRWYCEQNTACVEVAPLGMLLRSQENASAAAQNRDNSSYETSETLSDRPRCPFKIPTSTCFTTSVELFEDDDQLVGVTLYSIPE